MKTWRRTWPAAALLASVLAAGCSSVFPIEPLRWPRLPPNDTPEHAIQRFYLSYEKKMAQEYEDMFTGDFLFQFSTLDPLLRQQYSTGWFKDDEKISARNLFQGGTNSAGEYMQPATSIELTLAKTQPVNDTEGRDSTQYKMLFTPLDGVIEVPNPQNPADPTKYIMSGNQHRFYLVRGDVAQGLTTRQPADASHWYIWKWNDETVQLGGAPGSLETSQPAPGPTTWGRVKAQGR